MRHRKTEILFVLCITLMLGACGTFNNNWGPAPESPDMDIPSGDSRTLPGDMNIAVDDTGGPDAGPGVILSSIPDVKTELLQQANRYFTLSPDAQHLEFVRAETLYLNDSSDINLVRLGLYAVLTHTDRTGNHQRVRNDLRARLSLNQTPVGEDDLHPLAEVALHLLDERERLMAQLTSRNEELQHKLDELKAIEQQLRERDSPEIIRTLP